jgi:hypothetical protein
VTKPNQSKASTIKDDELKQALQSSLRKHFNANCSITGLKREVSKYSSSFVIEELDVALDNGDRRILLFKNLGNPALLEQVQMTKPGFMSNPIREIEVYRRLLATDQMGTAECLGSVCNSQEKQFWLFLEKVNGLELYQLGDFEIWLKVARWLARFQKCFGVPTQELTSGVQLLKYDREFYLAWPERVKAFLHGRSKSVQKIKFWMNDHYEVVVDRLMELPVTLLHGDFNASNIIVQKTAQSLRICPVDWEVAALGPGLIDLAALISGNWSADQRSALAGAYLGEIQKSGQYPAGKQMFLEDLNYCQLHLAMQWLGWSRNWSPPPEHKQDWLQRAIDLTDQIGP